MNLSVPRLILVPYGTIYCQDFDLDLATEDGHAGDRLVEVGRTRGRREEILGLGGHRALGEVAVDVDLLADLERRAWRRREEVEPGPGVATGDLLNTRRRRTDPEIGGPEGPLADGHPIAWGGFRAASKPWRKAVGIQTPAGEPGTEDPMGTPNPISGWE